VPSLSGQFDPRIGPLINVGVFLARTLTPSNAIPPSITTFPALLDTGANATFLSPSVAQTVGLKPMGLRPVVSATHTVPVAVYLVDLVLPFNKAQFILYATQVLEFSCSAGGPYQMLIGRDIICRGIFTLSSDGHFTFAI
jgi:hypothetical protein